MSTTAAALMWIWPKLAIALFVAVIILSYRIEKRSPELTNRTGLPRWAMLSHTITNFKVPRDRKAQLMRRVMLALLAAIIALFILVAFAVSMIERPAV